MTMTRSQVWSWNNWRRWGWDRSTVSLLSRFASNCGDRNCLVRKYFNVCLPASAEEWVLEELQYLESDKVHHHLHHDSHSSPENRNISNFNNNYQATFVWTIPRNSMTISFQPTHKHDIENISECIVNMYLELVCWKIILFRKLWNHVMLHLCSVKLSSNFLRLWTKEKKIF